MSLRSILGWITGRCLARLTRLITAPRIFWDGSGPEDRQRIYVANHTSNADTVLIWAALPPELRARTRPVAARDYWHASRIRRFIGDDVFHIVAIDRKKEGRQQDPVALMSAALDEGSSLILFPEGQRNTTDAPLLPLKPGIHHLGRAHPGIDIIPVWIDNLNGVMPKGEILPVPLICTLRFGAPMHIGEGETKAEFLARLEAALTGLAPQQEDRQT